MTRKAARPVPSKILYLWQKLGLKRIELFTQEDVEGRPEIHRDTDKLPEMHAQGSFAAAHQRHLDEEERRRKKHHGY